jgi:benzoate-CoA ligase family protein
MRNGIMGTVAQYTSFDLQDFPRDYNAAVDFIDGNLQAGRQDKCAVIDDQGRYTYGELAERVNRAGNALKQLGLCQESRVGLVMQDDVNFPAVFWGAIKAGLVPIPVNTLLTEEGYRHIIGDSRMRTVVISASLLERVGTALDDQPMLEQVVVAGGEADDGRPCLDDLLDQASPDLEPAPTCCDDVAFWLYSSGSTGAPKGVKHLHRHLRATSELYAKQVLGIQEDDVIFSAAKLFFAYGLGNGMTFPFSVGATAVYMAERPTPEAVMRVFREHQPTLYGGVPTLYASILADESNASENGSSRLRRCLSAGEALPEEVGKRWERRFGVEILDGIGSTEMLHIFLSNRPGQVRYGTSGVPVPGYQARLVGGDDEEVPDGEVGELLVKGPSAAEGYWNQREKSLKTFLGPWTRSGDKYYRDAEGYYHYCGRADDMMKVSGNWVSPFEIESTLIAHPKVLEAAVVQATDGEGMVKPMAYVVLKSDEMPSEGLKDELRHFVKGSLSPWKYPRWIEFIEELPKTATGKVQRFKLRQRAVNES